MNRLLQFEKYAHQRLPKLARDFYFDGACGEFTLKENESAFQRYSTAITRSGIAILNYSFTTQMTVVPSSQAVDTSSQSTSECI